MVLKIVYELVPCLARQPVYGLRRSHKIHLQLNSIFVCVRNDNLLFWFGGGRQPEGNHMIHDLLSAIFILATRQFI